MGERAWYLTEQRGLLRTCGQRQCCGGGHWGRSQVAPEAGAGAGARVRVGVGGATQARLGRGARRRWRCGPSGLEFPRGLPDGGGAVRAALQRCGDSDQLRQAAQVAADQVVDEGDAKMQRADSHEQAAGPLQGRARHRGAAAQERLPKPHLPAVALRGGVGYRGEGGPPAGLRPDTTRRLRLGEGSGEGARERRQRAGGGTQTLADSAAQQAKCGPGAGADGGGAEAEAASGAGAGPPVGAAFSGQELGAGPVWGGAELRGGPCGGWAVGAEPFGAAVGSPQPWS